MDRIYNEIEKMINDKSFDESMQKIRETLKNNLYDSKMYYYMGVIYQHKNELNKAYLCFENGLQYSNEEEKKEFINAIDKLKNNSLCNVNEFSIVILTYNNLEYTKQCIESIRKHNKLNNYEIILVDNNSTDGTVEWIKQQKNIKYVLNNYNNGFPKGCNQGIEIADKKNDIFLLNNDTIIMPNSIFNLRMALYEDEKIGSAGATTNCASYYQEIDERFNTLEEYVAYSIRNNIYDKTKHYSRLMLVGYAVIIKRNILDEIGMLDERFTPGNFEDDDIGLRIVMAGYKNIFCKDSFILHYGGASFSKDRSKYVKLLNINDKKFQDKWGFSSRYSLFIRNEIINLIDMPYDSKINVLEIGCACGATLLEIKNIYKNANLYGIELNENAAKVAGKNINISAENIENSSLNYEEGFFDYIIFADVLEHLCNPEKVLKNLKKYLKPDGYILASIPNVGNYTILMQLINGLWSYENAGILDRTHVKFFTFYEIAKMFEELEFTDIWIGSNQNTPQDEASIKFIDKICEISSNTTIKDQLISYQYFVKAKNKIINPKIQRINQLRETLGNLLRKLDCNVKDTNILSEIVSLVKENNLSVTFIVSAAKDKVYSIAKMLNNIALYCLENNHEEYVIKFLEEAFRLEKTDLEIVYNLAYVLMVAGEYKVALEYIDKSIQTNVDIQELKEQILKKI